MVWSAQQEAVFAHQHGHLHIEAVAGAGKTTALLECARRAPEQVKLVMAFAKPAAEELAARAGGAFVAGTSHAFALDWLTQLYGARFDAEKDRRVAEQVIGRDKDLLWPVVRTAAYAKACLRPPTSDMAIERGGAKSAQAALVARYATQALDAAAEDLKRVSYDDMVWLPARLGLTHPCIEWLGVDEAQDLSAAQRYVVRALLAPNGRVVAVGDRAQAIFGFRGADSRSFDKLKRELKAAELPLSTTYRCARAVVQYAQDMVPQLEARPDAPEGEVREDLDVEEMVAKARAGDFILSRTRAPLVGYAMRIAGRGVPVSIANRDLQADLQRFIADAKADDVGDLEAYVEQRAERAAERETKNARELRDKADAVRAIARNADSLEEVRRRVGALFTDESSQGDDRVTLSTIHSAKGLERDRVWLLVDTLQLWRDEEEEYNLHYVGATRARHALYTVRTPRRDSR